jgi:hypothetical protein
MRGAEPADRAVTGEHQQAADRGVGQGDQREPGRGGRVADRPGEHHRHREQYRREAQAHQSPGQLRRAGQQRDDRAAQQRHRTERQAEDPGGGRAPPARAVPRGGGHRVHHVVEDRPRRLVTAGAQVQQFAVADVQLGRTVRAVEHGATEAGQRPAVPRRGIVGQVGTGVPEQGRQQVGEGHVGGQREIHPHAWRDNGYPAEPTGHALYTIHHG